jgi:hypothetical protein
MPVREDASGDLVAAQANNAANATVKGLALHDAIDDQPLAYMTTGQLVITSGATVGDVYVLSAAAAGGIAPEVDLTSTNIVTLLGVASAVGAIELKLFNTGIVKP